MTLDRPWPKAPGAARRRISSSHLQGSAAAATPPKSAPDHTFPEPCCKRPDRPPPWLKRKALLATCACASADRRRGRTRGGIGLSGSAPFGKKCFSLATCISLGFSSVQSCSTLCDPMNCNTPGLPVHHQLPEFTQIHAHLVGDATQPYHPLLSPSPPAPNPSQHQGLFQWVSSSHLVAKVFGVSASASVLPMNTQDYLPQDGLGGSPCSPRDSQESSPTPQFKSINFSALSFLYSPTLTSIRDHWKNHSLDQTDLCWQSNISAF